MSSVLNWQSCNTILTCFNIISHDVCLMLIFSLKKLSAFLSLVPLLFVQNWCKKKKIKRVAIKDIRDNFVIFSTYTCITKRKRKEEKIRITSLVFVLFFFFTRNENSTQRETKICKKNKIQNSFVVSKSTWKVCWLVTFYIQTCQLHNPL